MLTLEIGRMITVDPGGNFHIFFKNTHLASIVRHFKAGLADATKPRPSSRNTLENKIQSASETKAEPEFIEKTIQTFVQSGILNFTETDKVTYKAA